ncbi:hypothetical protein GDO81_004635 [Engystomops pustulosus]|uniref:Secreted protein n=1 Tax=Engystomops pustulosus TaxID=76066 RepID=A0AAV6ZXC9_ENGPU|nr:hypothetical protein GDO81_004635 [Engystomops pustulosus]
MTTFLPLSVGFIVIASPKVPRANFSKCVRFSIQSEVVSILRPIVTRFGIAAGSDLTEVLVLSTRHYILSSPPSSIIHLGLFISLCV